VYPAQWVPHQDPAGSVQVTYSKGKTSGAGWADVKYMAACPAETFAHRGHKFRGQVAAVAGHNDGRGFATRILLPAEPECHCGGQAPAFWRPDSIVVYARNSLFKESRSRGGRISESRQALDALRRNRARIFTVAALAAGRVVGRQTPEMHRSADRIRLAGTLIPTRPFTFRPKGRGPIFPAIVGKSRTVPVNVYVRTGCLFREHGTESS